MGEHQKASKYYERDCLPAKFSFAFYVFINSLNCRKQAYFGWNLPYRSKSASYKSISVFQEIFTSIDKTFISGRGQSTWHQFYKVLRVS